MARNIFYVFFLLLVLMKNTVGSVNLNVHPTDINPGLTQSLTVNCSFTFAQACNISDIISLILSKMVVEENKQEKFQDLISINTFSPDQINVISPVNGSMLGHISNDGESFLTIQWTYPGNNQAGLYRCEADGMDSTGHLSEVVKTVLVTPGQPGMGQLINKVSDLQRQLVSQENLTNHLVLQLDRQQEIERNQSQNIDYLTSQLDRQQEIERNQSQNIDYLISQLGRQEKIIDTLLSLTKNQSDMINKQQSKINTVQAQLNYLRIEKFATDFYISAIYENHAYLLSKADWKDATVAEQTCKDYNGYIAQIDDSDEDTFIDQFLNSTSGFNDVLVSGTDEGHEGQWTYTGTDIDMTYINWYTNEPNQPDNHCMAKRREDQWHFVDYPCVYIWTGTKVLCDVKSTYSNDRLHVLFPTFSSSPPSYTLDCISPHTTCFMSLSSIDE